MSIIVIGKNSFIVKHLQKNSACSDWIFLSHTEILENKDWFKNNNTVINFSFSPELIENKYDKKYDIDSQIAEQIKDKNIHYIMISSRMVYGEAQKPNYWLNEESPINPTNQYGINKYKIEQNLSDTLPSKNLTILRPSNIFGNEYKRKTFFGMALSSLIEQKSIKFNITPHSIRDFLHVDHFCNHIIKITNTPKSGIYNLGAGFGTPAQDVANWLIKGYGQGELIIEAESEAGQFQLDMTKTNKTFNLTLYTPQQCKADCIAIGKFYRQTTS